MSQDPGSGVPMSERMQSLLSRAVEDQVSEQRQLAAVLAEVRTQLGQLTSQLGAMPSAGGSPQLDQALGAIAGNVRDAVRLLGERLDTVGRLVQERGHDLAEQRAMIGELKAAVDGHTAALTGMTGGLAALPAFGERIDGLHGGLTGLADRLTGLEELAASVTALQQRSEAVDAGLRELRQAFSGVAARAAQLPAREDLEDITGRVADSVDGLGGRLSRLETSIPSLLERLDALADAHEETRESVQAVHDRLAEHAPASSSGPELADLRDEIAGLREHLESGEADDDDVQALMERLDALHEALLGGDGVVARLAAIEAAGSAVEPTGLDADAVEEIVTGAVADSERRLAEHVDEAILTLAEALLRRRSRARAADAVAPSVLAAPEATPEPDAADVDVDQDDAGADEDADDYEAEDHDAADLGLDGPDETGDAATESGKRKPWWRPGG
jgi:hypothetical protein